MKYFYLIRESCIQRSVRSIIQMGSRSERLHFDQMVRYHRYGCCRMKIHLITLYQRGPITKLLIREKDLKKFSMGFWYCIKIDHQFVPVSGTTRSNVIEQSKNFFLLDPQPSEIHCSLLWKVMKGTGKRNRADDESWHYCRQVTMINLQSAEISKLTNSFRLAPSLSLHSLLPSEMINIAPFPWPFVMQFFWFINDTAGFFHVFSFPTVTLHLFSPSA